MLVFEGPHGVQLYRAVALRAGLKLYVSTKILPNRKWTPKAMLEAAGRITGEKYGRGQYDKAIVGLTKWLEQQPVEP